MSKVTDRIYNAHKIKNHHDVLGCMITDWSDISCRLSIGTYRTIDVAELAELLAKHERAVSRANVKACNEDYDAEPVRSRAFKAIRKFLPKMPENALYINSDPRGYALKINDDYIRDHKDDHGSIYSYLNRMECDFGGYGILCPDWLMGDK
jgi:hypothetical protein